VTEPAAKAKVTLIAADNYGPALGTRFVSAALRKAGFETTVILARGWIRASVAKGESRAFSAEVHDGLARLAEGSIFVGVSLATPNFHKAREITRELKARLDVPIVWGGSHVIAMPDECLKEADFVCLGEGEKAAVEFANQLQARAQCDTIPGIVCQGGAVTWAQPLGDAEIPTPDWAVDGSHFVATSNEIVQVTTASAALHLSSGERNFEYSCAPTRGCPYKCTYCINARYFDLYEDAKRFRRRHVEDVIDELTWAATHLPGLRSIMFDDDCFMAAPESYIEEFCEKYKARVGLPFVVRGAHARTLTERKLDLLCSAGMVKIRMGIETGSDRIRKLYDRTWETNEHVLSGAELVRRFLEKGTLKWAMYDVIVDNPWEAEEDARATFELVARLPRPFALYVLSLCFYPGTPLHERAKKEGIIRGDALDPAYTHNFFTSSSTPRNTVLNLFNSYDLSPRLQRFLARPGILNAAALKFLVYLSLVFPEISLLTGGRTKYEFLFRAAVAPETIPRVIWDVDRRQRRSRRWRMAVPLRSAFRWCYWRTVGRNAAQSFLLTHQAFGLRRAIHGTVHSQAQR
jgi:anaerobic magnesium-protoporphyrin IX monomethyl ester cyclase